MKKTLVVLLILAVAGGVFAQDISWSGGVQTGLKIDIQDASDDVMIWSDDDDTNEGVRARLNLEVADENWGVQLGFGANISEGTGNSAFVYNAHGWMDFLNNMIRVRAGYIDPGVWTTKGPEDFNVSSGLGVRLEVMPIEGLSVGATLKFDNDMDMEGSGIGGAATMTVQQFFQETALGFSFSMPDMMGLYIAAGLQLDSDYNGNDKEMQMIFGLGISPMDALSINVEAQISNLGDYSKQGWMWLIEKVSYKVMDNFTVALRMDQKFQDKDIGFANDFFKTWLKFEPTAEYGITEQISVGAGIPLTIEAGKAGKEDMGFSSLVLDVWGKYAIGGAFVKVGYGFTFTTEDFSTTGESYADHYIRLLFGYSF